MRYSKVLKSHLPTAKLIAESLEPDYIADCSGLEINDGTEFITAMREVRAIALDEGYDPRYVTVAETIQNWLRGLPTACTVPFETYNIYQWLYANTKLSPDDTDNKHIKAEDSYWRICAHMIDRYGSK